MACSKYEYVKDFESHPTLLRDTYLVVRLDGKGFTKFTKRHNFKKPNDDVGLFVMTTAALAVLREVPDAVMAYGQSDEYSFVLRKGSDFYNRREAKIASVVCSIFTGAYILTAQKHFELRCAPVFDARVVAYPNIRVLKDYLSWRQVDCHINNMYNYCFWKLADTQDPAAVYDRLKDTNSGQKNEILFSEFGINYAKLPELHRKGTVIYKDKGRSALADLNLANFVLDSPATRQGVYVVSHVDFISERFWAERPWLLELLDA